MLLAASRVAHRWKNRTTVMLSYLLFPGLLVRSYPTPEQSGCTLYSWCGVARGSRVNSVATF